MFKVSVIKIKKMPWWADKNKTEAAIKGINDQIADESQEKLISYLVGWKKENIPKFRKIVKLQEVVLTTTAKVFNLQNLGVDHAYDIRPKKRRYLKFKTKSGQIAFAKRVRHPGFKGRKFTDRLISEMAPRYRELSIKALRRLR